jgi:hypothetical protein
MPLSELEKVDVRRHCGYPTQAAGGAGGQTWFHYRMFNLLEIRMNSLTDPELGVIRRYLAALTNLELAVPRSGDNLDTQQASVWTRNPSEPRDRLALFDEWRRRLCAFMAVSPGPFFPTSTPRVIV